MIDPNIVFKNKKEPTSSKSDELSFSKDISLELTCVECYRVTELWIKAGISVTLSSYKCGVCNGNKWGWNPAPKPHNMDWR